MILTESSRFELPIRHRHGYISHMVTKRVIVRVGGWNGGGINRRHAFIRVLPGFYFFLLFISLGGWEKKSEEPKQL